MTGGTLNEAAFNDPRSRQTALGQKEDIWLDPYGLSTLPVTNGGMLNPAREDLPPGTALYRFADSDYGPERSMSGGWWLQRRELDQLIRFAEINNLSLGRAARVLCCVPPQWGARLDYLVRIGTRGVIAAYAGLANSAHARDKQGRVEIEARNNLASWRVRQLFIPGLSKMARRWLNFEGAWSVSSTWIYE